MAEEIWKDVSGYEGYYQVSNFGRVKSLGRFQNNHGELQYRPEKIKDFGDNGHGYKIVSFCLDGKQKMMYVHRLVAMAFIANPNNLPQVNHKDEDKSNNCVDNLEWCDQAYNNRYGTAKERGSAKTRNHKNTSCPVLQFDMNGNFIREWPSMREVQRSGIARCENVYRACVGIYKQANGFIWRYK